jgi:hypothetical protein
LPLVLQAMQRIQLEKKSWQWATLLILALIWGTSFILMKRGLESYDYMQVAALRIFFSFIFLLPLTLRHIKVISKENIASLIIVGMVGFAIPAALLSPWAWEGVFTAIPLIHGWRSKRKASTS